MGTQEQNKTIDYTPSTDRLNNFGKKAETIPFSDQSGKCKCFISIGCPDERANVVHGIGNSGITAYKQAKERALKLIKEHGANPPWLKADFVVWEKTITISELTELASAIKKYYFKFGIAFDPLYNQAFLQQEINANCFFKYEKSEQRIARSQSTIALAGRSLDEDSRKTAAVLHWNNIEFYLKHYRNRQTAPAPDKLREITIFKTKSYFYDEDTCHELAQSELAASRRELPMPDAAQINALISKSSAYLSSTLLETGQFVYGYFSCFNRALNSYNIVRHALAVYALAETYALNEDESLIAPIKSALAYMLEHYVYEVDPYAFIVDHSNHEEIKLGGLGVAILAISKCLEIGVVEEHRETYLEILKKIGRGIIYMQNPATGQFTHVLRYPDLELVETFRIVYYSGEAAFALSRLYQIDRDAIWLRALERAFDYFIANDYWQNNDHWLAYCTNELTSVIPDDRYFTFGLKNAFHNLDFVINRNTTWATFLEMLMAAHNMTTTIKKLGKDHLLEGYDIEKLEAAIQTRLERQLNGIFFPELAMYFKKPSTILYGIFVRHHSFRVRNDDVAHHLSGYCHYLTDYLKHRTKEWD